MKCNVVYSITLANPYQSTEIADLKVYKHSSLLFY